MSTRETSTKECFDDLLACGADAEICKLALALGIKETAGVDNLYRLEMNIKVAEKIRKELVRRAEVSTHISAVVTSNLTVGE